MLRYSGKARDNGKAYGKAKGRKDKVVEGWGRLSSQTRVKTGWGIGYDEGQDARQKTRLIITIVIIIIIGVFGRVGYAAHFRP